MLCGDHEKVISHLDEKFGETRTNMGMSSNGGVLEVFSSEKTGTWTVLITSPGGPTCLVAAGKNWETLQTPGDPAAYTPVQMREPGPYVPGRTYCEFGVQATISYVLNKYSGAVIAGYEHGQAAQPLVDLWNATGIQSNEKADEAVVFTHPRFTEPLIGIFRDGCLVGFAIVDAEAYHNVVEGSAS